jgi:hypothetical protein
MIRSRKFATMSGYSVGFSEVQQTATSLVLRCLYSSYFLFPVAWYLDLIEKWWVYAPAIVVFLSGSLIVPLVLGRWMSISYCCNRQVATNEKQSHWFQVNYQVELSDQQPHIL